MKKYNLKIGYLSTYPPRECGIATYCFDLVKAISKNLNKMPKIIAVNNGEDSYDYPKEVIFQIRDQNLKYYQRAAELVNNSDLQLINLQHEFGIYGSDSPERNGEYILEFLRNLKKPVVTTFHTILSGPTAEKVKVIREIFQLSEMNIVMIKSGIRYLREIYYCNPEKIRLLHHGVPDIQKLEPTKKYKPNFGLADKIVIATHGLINPGKGLQYVIRAIPDLIKKYPNIIYLIIGETHPQIKKERGEDYRQKLINEVKKLKIEKYVKFIDRYLSTEEIINYLRATDIYITPYLNPQQISSGTLAYAVGAGKVCVSTRFLYAKGILNRGRGVYIDYKKPHEIVRKIDDLLSNPRRMKNISRKAYLFGRRMIWSTVAKEHLKLYSKIILQKPWLTKLSKIKRKITFSALKASQILDISKE